MVQVSPRPGVGLESKIHDYESFISCGCCAKWAVTFWKGQKGSPWGSLLELSRKLMCDLFSVVSAKTVFNMIVLGETAGSPSPTC